MAEERFALIHSFIHELYFLAIFFGLGIGDYTPEKNRHTLLSHGNYNLVEKTELSNIII